MNDEIIEFLLHKLEQNYKCEKEDYFILYKPDIKDLLDYITNLQEQLHQASLDIQELTEKDLYCPTNCDKLTNLQQELKEANESVKWWANRFKAVEKGNERLKEIMENLTTMTVCGDNKQIKNTAQYKLDIYKLRIDKAINLIESYNLGKYDYTIPPDGIIELLDILKGDNND